MNLFSQKYKERIFDQSNVVFLHDGVTAGEKLFASSIEAKQSISTPAHSAQTTPHFLHLSPHSIKFDFGGANLLNFLAPTKNLVTLLTTKQKAYPISR
jgi:hypothetical protein